MIEWHNLFKGDTPKNIAPEGNYCSEEVIFSNGKTIRRGVLRITNMFGLCWYPTDAGELGIDEGIPVNKEHGSFCFWADLKDVLPKLE